MFKWLWKQLKDWRNAVIFAIVAIILSCEVWIPYIIGAITGDAYWFGIGSVCWAFWLAPFTPFLPLCIVITLGIRKITDKLRRRKDANT
jgi:hypothetical protein